MKDSSSDSPNSGKSAFGIKLLLIILIAALLRLFLLGQKPFWADEGIVWWMALGEIEHDSPIINTYAFNWAIQVFGWHEFAGRLPSALFGVLSIPVIYAIGRTLFDRKFGLWVAGLASLSAYLVPVSQEMRIYSLLGLLILLATWFFLKILMEEKAGIGWWIGLFLIGIVGQYSHCLFALVLAYFGGVLILKKGWAGIRTWAKYWAILVAVILVSLPEVLKSLTVTVARHHVLPADLWHLKWNIYRVLRSYFCFLFGDVLINLPGAMVNYLRAHPFHLVISIAMVVVWILIAYRSSTEISRIIRGAGTRALVIRTLLGMLIAFSLLFFFIGVSTSAHLIFIYVPFLFLVSLYWTTAQTPFRNVVSGLFLLLTAISLIWYYGSPTFAHERADWRAAAKLLQREMKQDDALLILRARNAYYTLKFYVPELNGDIYYRPRHDPALLQDQPLMLWWDEKSPVEKVISLMDSHKRVWVVGSLLTRRGDEALAGLVCRIWNFGHDLEVRLIESNAMTGG